MYPFRLKSELKQGYHWPGGSLFVGKCWVFSRLQRTLSLTRTRMEHAILFQMLGYAIYRIVCVQRVSLAKKKAEQTLNSYTFAIYEFSS